LSKSPLAFRTISEAADEIGVPQHVLRFWETKFSFLRPMKRAGGRRFYRPQDVAVLRGVKALLYAQGYKIEGVQKLYRQNGLKRLVEAGGPSPEADLAFDEVMDDDLQAAPANAPASHAAPNGSLSPQTRARLKRALDEVETAKARLDSLLARS
jgi:DNA-binding transcriptional MerR regulator